MNENIDKCIEYFDGIGQIEHPQLQKWLVKCIEKNKFELLNGEKIHLVGNMDLNKFYILKLVLNKFGHSRFVITNEDEFEVTTYNVVDIINIDRVFIRAVKDLKQRVENLK